MMLLLLLVVGRYTSIRMPSQSRATDTFSTGHDCDATGTIASPASEDVIVNNLGAARIGDPADPHNVLVGEECVPHTVVIEGGSTTVIINSKGAARVGDAIDNGSITSGSPNVITDSGIQAPTVILSNRTDSEGNSLPDIMYPDQPTRMPIEQQREVIDTAGDVENQEVSEYGDGGVSTGDGEHNIPNVDNEGTVGTGVPAETVNQGTTERQPLSGDGLNFLPHTDPRILPELRDKLVQLAQRLNTTLTITSAYRSPEYNRRVGGAANSTHVQGKAVDIVQTGYTIQERQELIRVAHELGLVGIGIYNTFTHVDIGSKRAWGSPSSYRHLYKFPWAQDALEPLGYRVK